MTWAAISAATPGPCLSGDNAPFWRWIDPRWGVWSAKPGGAALQSLVGSTPTRLRHFDAMNPKNPLRPPALDALLKTGPLQALLQVHGRAAVTQVAREDLAGWRKAPKDAAKPVAFDQAEFVAGCARQLANLAAPSLRPVFNLTGTVLHTNLGRAVLAPEAVDAAIAAMRGFSALEFDLASGTRGDRDAHVEGLLCELTGAQAATVVNNNASAVLLVLAALAARKQVVVSRGELVEIGGAFRIPDIMRRAGAQMVEVGTTNRTHWKDYEDAVTASTALVMKVHTSNYAIQGFTASVPAGQLAQRLAERGISVAEDLGSGTLVDLTRWGLPAEPTPRQSIEAGVGVVTFSGDKLLGGPQAGLIVGRKDLIQKIKKNPLKRALRCDKATLAALEATLKLYRDPDRLAERLPTLRMLTRTAADIEAQAARVLPALAAFLSTFLAAFWASQPGATQPEPFQLRTMPCKSQIGAGSMPVDSLPSACIGIGPAVAKKSSGAFCKIVSDLLRNLPQPVLGRIEDGWVKLDLRCLDGAQAEQALIQQLRGGTGTQ